MGPRASHGQDGAPPGVWQGRAGADTGVGGADSGAGEWHRERVGLAPSRAMPGDALRCHRHSGRCHRHAGPCRRHPTGPPNPPVPPSGDAGAHGAAGADVPSLRGTCHWSGSAALLKLFFVSADGRFRRRDFAVGLFAIAVAVCLAWLVLRPWMNFRWVSLILTAGAAWPIATHFIKRLHDRGKGTVPWLAVYLGPTALLSVLQQLEIGYGWSRSGAVHPLDFWPNMLSFLALATFLVGVFDCLFLPPEHGRNDYGHDPRVPVRDE